MIEELERSDFLLFSHKESVKSISFIEGVGWDCASQSGCDFTNKLGKQLLCGAGFVHESTVIVKQEDVFSLNCLKYYSILFP